LIRRSIARLLFAGLTLMAGAALAQAPAQPTRWVTDSTGFLSEGARRDLDGQLENYQGQTGHQVLVWIDRTTGGVPLEDFTVRAFAAWKVGRKGLDDGLVLFVFPDERKLRVEVGYGLEGQVPDAIASRIIQETIVPRVQAGDRDGAIRAGLAALIGAIDGRGPPARSAVGSPPDRSPSAEGARLLSLGQMILFGLAVVAFLILFATNPSLAVYLLFSVLSSGRGGGGRGGGGFSGGRGRSGGGGASGSW
jgi:uncharacterized protein